MDRKFNEAWFNADHVVLNRRLHPLCLEDAMVLSLVESPFLLGAGSEVKYAMADLQLAVTICSTPAEVFFNARLETSWLKRLKRILWSRRCRKLNLQRECQKFVTYIDDFFSPPDTWHDADDAGDGTLRAPWILGNVTFLIRNTTFTPREVWRMPLGQALWYCATTSEQLGAKIQLVSEDEQAGLEALGKAE